MNAETKLHTDAADAEKPASIAIAGEHSAPPSRGGAPSGNTNRVSHGLRGFGWPKGCQRLERRHNEFRRALEAAVVERQGEVGIMAAAAIDTACRWERHGLLAARWLRLEHDTLQPSDRLAFSREVAKAAAERDKALDRLKLDAGNDIDALYAALRAGSLDADSKPANVPGAKSEPLEGNR